jgi:DNA polymerase III delta prime subunit
VAKLYARLLKACGFLSDGGIELTKPQDFKGSAIGQSGEKAAAIFQRSQGKVLVIDEAYGMSGDDPFNKDIVDVVVAETPDRGGVDMVVVLCGYEDLIQEMFDTSNPGLARRFPENLCRITFDPYSRKELRAIFVKSVLSMGASADFGCAEAAGLALERESAVHNFGNASAAEKFAERLLRFVRTRARNEGIFTNNELSLHATDVEDMLKSERLEDKYAGYVLNSELRDYVDKWSLEVASSRILRLPGGPWPHLVLKGYPGTGKSTSINVMARELYEKGALPTKRVKEVLATTLQSRYVGGGTSKDVNDAFQAAQGGVLFIDEAHNLVPGGADYKRDVIASIVGCMTGKYKNKVLVVLAGYPGRMDELMATDPGLPGRFPASANLPEVGHEENVKNLKETLLHCKDLRYKSRVPSSANEILINYFTQRKKLRGENYRNRGEAELLAVDIHSKAMRRFEREAQQKANGSPTLLNNKPKTALLYLEESLNNWSSGNREYLLEDVKSSCDHMLEKARKDVDDALAHTRRGLGLKPTLPEEMNTIVAAEDKHGHQYMQHEQSQLIGKMKLQNSSSARFNQLLGPKMSQALAEEFQKSPGAYWNMLAGENNDLEKSLKEILQGFNNGLNDSDRATSDEFEAFFKNMLEEVGERLKSGNAAAYKRIKEDRKAWAHSQDDADKLRELDSNMRKNTWMLITTVTQVRTRKCGICGRNDEAGSGCAYGGSSPTPFFVTTEYFSQEQKLAFEQ